MLVHRTLLSLDAVKSNAAVVPDLPDGRAACCNVGVPAAAVLMIFLSGRADDFPRLHPGRDGTLLEIEPYHSKHSRRTEVEEDEQ